MKKLNTSPISGAQELLPGVQATFDQLKNRIIKVYKDHGYFNVEANTGSSSCFGSRNVAVDV